VLGVVVAVVAALLVIGAVVTYRMARSNDTVESFRRQIDALSPEARRGTVDQLNRIDDTSIDSTSIESTSIDSSSIDTTAIDDPAIDNTIDNTPAEDPDTPDAQSSDPPDADTAGQPDDDIADRPDGERGS
jgi:hypothetical protein